MDFVIGSPQHHSSFQLVILNEKQIYVHNYVHNINDISLAFIFNAIKKKNMLDIKKII